MRRGSLAVCGALALLIAACATPKHVATPLPPSAPTSVEGLAAAIQESAERSDREHDDSVRAKLADQALGFADACMAKAPQAAGCLYGKGLALGLQARVHPLHFSGYLKSMLDSLQAADTADPTYDNAGPSRVRAQVLINAPSWPTGPGDADAGLAAARRAVELRPQYPPNLLILADAQAKSDDLNGARETYSRAREAAQALPAGESRDGWIRKADQALQRK
jgi:hypothetical protein